MTKAIKRRKKPSEYLRRERAMKAASQMEVLFASGDQSFPGMVETMWAMFNDDSVFVDKKFNKAGALVSESEKASVTVKEKLQIAAAFASLTALRARALHEVGQGKGGPRKIEHHTHLTKIDLTVADFAKITDPDIRAKLQTQQLEAADVEVR